MNRSGIDPRMIASGVQRVRSNHFVANEVRSKLKHDRSSIIKVFIRKNKLDVTLNDEIMACQENLARLRVMNKLQI